MAVLRVLNSKGDTAVEWDVDDKASVDRAIAQFERELANGRVAVRTKAGEPDEVIRKFDPSADEIIAFAPIQGG